MLTLYLPLVTIHNYLRWIVLIILLFTLYRAYVGWVQNKSWSNLDDKLGLVFTSAMDTQFLLGLLVYGVLKFSVTPRILTEHIIPMIAAVIITHIGRSRSKNASRDQSKHKQSAIWFSVSLLIVVLSIPWYRPLLRGL